MPTTYDKGIGMQAKLELVVRCVGTNMIMTGVMISKGHKAASLRGMEMYATATGAGKFTVHISKATFTPTDNYDSDFESEPLSSLPTSNIWRGLKSDNPNEFGGVMVARDNQLFANECKDEVSRLAVVSVINYEENILSIPEHAAFRSVNSRESSDWFLFEMESDTSDETVELLNQLSGDGLMGFYRKPFWTRDDGTRYALRTDASLESFKIYGILASELIKNGSATTETEELMREYRLNRHDDHDYICFLQKLHAACPFLLDLYDRLPTAEEVAQIELASKAAVDRLTD